MTPEEIKAYRAYAKINNGLSPAMSEELLAALEEAEQQNERLRKNFMFSGSALAEAQQTIARQRDQIKTQDEIITGHSRIIARYHDAIFKISQDTQDQSTAAFAWSVLE